MARLSSSSSLLLLFTLSILLCGLIMAEEMIDPCRMTVNEEQDEGMTGRSNRGCQAACTAQSLNGEDTNGMCILDRCYCTDVGYGTCQDQNHEGCDTICQKLSLDWIGVCSDGECNCLF